MSKVINISSYRKRKNLTGQMDYESTWAVRDKFEIAACIVDELFISAEEYIRDCGFDPAVFSLVDDTARGCLYADLNEFYEGGEETLSLAYDAVVGGVRYAVVADASVSDDEIYFNTIFVKWDGEEWLEYADGNWIQGPGPDFV